MTYIAELDKVQFGQEAAIGTPVNTTFQPEGLTNVLITPRVQVQQLQTKQGSTMPSKYSYVTKRWAEVLIEGVLDYNRAMVWLDNLFAVDATSPHTYIADEDAAQTPKGLTMVFGQTGLIYQVAGIVAQSLKFACDGADPWTFSLKGFGRAATDGATLQSLTTDVPELVYGYETALYMDEDLDATIGTTARADVAFSFEQEMISGTTPLFHQGDQEWDSIKAGRWGGSLKQTIEADATALDSLGDIIDAANNGKGFTIRNQATDGTNTLKLDFCGVALSAPVIPSDFEGARTIEFDLVPQWNSVYDSCFGAELTIA